MSTTPGYVSNAELASRLSTLVDRWNTRENQMIALLTQEEGTVVVTDGLGVNHTLPSFPQLQKDVTALTDDLTGAVSQVRDMTSAVTALAAGAADSASAASDSADRAEAAATGIEDAVAGSAAASAQAVAKAAEAAASAATAADEADVAVAAANAASDNADTATSAATAASTSASQASASATAADASRVAAAGLLDDMTDLADLVEADAQAAASSKDAAAASAIGAAGSATAATDQANAATASAATASTKASEASGSATTAASHASSASGSAAAASSSASAAAGAKVAAEAARDKANLYANAPQGTEVSPGEYSAKHWAAQAQAAATGALIYMGSWDASTGAYPPEPVKGHFYKVTVSGTVSSVSYNAGDQVVYNGTGWDKIDNTDAVTSVAGKSGAVELVAGDIGGLGALATRGDVDFTAHVTGKPTTYPPSTHTHTKAQVGLDKVDNTADLDKPISTATQTALDGKAAASHSHTIANVTGLQDALDGKAAASHSHTIANVSGLQGALDAKANLSGASFSGNVTAPNLIAGGSGNGAYVQIGDDVRLVDVGVAHCAGVRSTTDGNVGYLQFGTGASVGWNGSVLAIDSGTYVGGRLTVADQLYLNGGWFRSQQSGTGWYHEAHGGGWFMQDNTWIRSYGSKRLLISSGGGSDGDLRLESVSPTIACYDADHGTTHWIHCNDNQHGFLANNSFSWCAYRTGSNEWHCTGNVVAYASDVRLKTNIVDASTDKVSDFFDRFRVREFDWDYDAIAELNPVFNPSADHEIGGIAQEAEEVYPLMVNEHEHNGIKTIQWEKAVPLLIAEVQSLRKRVAELEGGA
ncbi:tail fiber domain-containing protein [uncultured Xanthomonas sp.]|uniref:tail fiber domain-containing protein n=1 Tax=uncultured Xanthomonas sp. TaxID=152831 RepID=UPI0025E6EDEE|nr:tail fiber domain-containing protein [uncultured Xanthomonas sp.]